MSKTTFRAHNKRCTDRAISRVFAELRADRRARTTFTRLLAVAHERTDLLRTPPGANHRHVSVDALRNLASFSREIGDEPERWPGAQGHAVGVVGSLARHVLGRYRTPHFLGSVWFGTDTSIDRQRRWWFVHHARGLPFRRVGLPTPMTRRMEHHFLRSPDHLDVMQALRRAEVLGLGGSVELADAIVVTRLGRTLDDAEHWRAVIELFVRCGGELELDRVPRLVEYLAAFVGGAPVLPGGAPERERGPVALRGALGALIDASDRWHDAAPASRLAWRKSRWRDCAWEPGVDGLPVGERWHLVELLDGPGLTAEGRAMGHCVATYAWRCRLGRSRIWSLRREIDGHTASMLTIEVDPRCAAIVQIRGPRNDRGVTFGHALLRAWAEREKLTIARGA